LNYLADACALIAFHGYGGQTMSGPGAVAMGEGDVFVSPVSVWEISRKVALGKLPRPSPSGYAGSLAEWLRRLGYRVMPLNWDDCERANALPMHHKDPMDRMLIATALDRDMTVISDDEIFARYGVSTVW
jgi:PIN domain nuclease of toxin-antitoxin system